MLLTPTELQSNLERLRTNLKPLRCCEPKAEYETSAQQAASRIPLCHTVAEGNLKDLIASGALLSPDQRKIPPRHRADAILSGTNDICFYLGSAAFPDNDFGFLFSNVLTGAPGEPASATPFDSGGCISRYTLPAGTDGPSHVRIHSMPVPTCRGYLGDLLASHFEDTRAYLTGKEFACPACKQPLADPHGMSVIRPDEHALFRMHEVRIPSRVDLKPPLLLAVFAPQSLVPPSLAPLIASGVRLVPYDNADGRDRTRALRRASLDYILNHILN